MAIVAGVSQAALHLVNVYGFDGRIESLHADNEGEGNVFTWASSSVLVVCATLCLLLALADRARTLKYWMLAAILAVLSLDDSLVIHEQAGVKLVRHLGLDDRLSRVFWPLLLAPLALVAAFVIWEVSRTARRELVVLRGSILLLAVAVILDVGLYPAAPDTGARDALEPGFVAIEEGLELSATLLLAGGLASVFVGRVAATTRGHAQPAEAVLGSRVNPHDMVLGDAAVAQQSEPVRLS